MSGARLEELRALLNAVRVARTGEERVDPAVVAETVRHLNSPQAIEALSADPYWPKWDSPWWRMRLLWEMGLADLIPPEASAALIASLDSHCLHSFPVRIEDVPPGVDPVRGIPCHCQLGTMYCVLATCDVEMDAKLPWIRPWFMRYQLPDGGLNCDEAAYTRSQPHSSMVSTLPPLEAVLTRAAPTPEEVASLDRGAEYLLRRGLLRSLSKGSAIIDESWLQPCFPRFYHYDVLRGLTFVVEWAVVRRKPLPAEAVVEVVRVLADQTDEDGHMIAGRRCWEGAMTLRQGRDGTWKKGQPAGSFPLLETVGVVGKPCEWLTKQWMEAVEGLRRLDVGGLLVE